MSLHRQKPDTYDGSVEILLKLDVYDASAVTRRKKTGLYDSSVENGRAQFGLPVSTTHVLSSAVAATMAANGSGLQKDTLRNILLAWVLTLPVCVFLGASLFAFSINVLLHGALH